MAGASGQQVEQEIDEAMKKLEELARRQEQLADRAQDGSRAGFEQRWQQEMLRREAEDLRRQLEQLQRRQESSRRQQAGAQGAQGSQGQDSSQGGRGSRQQLDRAIEQLRRASQEMERGSQGGDPRSASAGALRELQRAVDLMEEQRRQQSASALAELARESEQLVEDQERAAQRLQESLRVALEALKAQGGRQNGPLPTGMTREEEIELSDLKSDMGERVGEIEKGLQRQARALRGRNDDASRALLNALMELQQSEASPTIQYAADLIRRGLAPYAASNEEAVSRALRQLRDDIQKAGQIAREERGGDDRGLARMLSEVERSAAGPSRTRPRRAATSPTERDGSPERDGKAGRRADSRQGAERASRDGTARLPARLRGAATGAAAAGQLGVVRRPAGGAAASRRSEATPMSPSAWSVPWRRALRKSPASPAAAERSGSSIRRTSRICAISPVSWVTAGSARQPGAAGGGVPQDAGLARAARSEAAPTGRARRQGRSCAPSFRRPCPSRTGRRSRSTTAGWAGPASAPQNGSEGRISGLHRTGPVAATTFGALRGLAAEIRERIVRSEVEGGLRLTGLKNGSRVLVQTVKPTSTSFHIRNGQTWISGHPEFCPRPVRVSVRGLELGGLDAEGWSISVEACTWSSGTRGTPWSQPRRLSRFGSTEARANAGSRYSSSAATWLVTPEARPSRL